MKTHLSIRDNVLRSTVNDIRMTVKASDFFQVLNTQISQTTPSISLPGNVIDLCKISKHNYSILYETPATYKTVSAKNGPRTCDDCRRTECSCEPDSTIKNFRIWIPETLVLLTFTENRIITAHTWLIDKSARGLSFTNPKYLNSILCWLPLPNLYSSGSVCLPYTVMASNNSIPALMAAFDNALYGSVFNNDMGVINGAQSFLNFQLGEYDNDIQSFFEKWQSKTPKQISKCNLEKINLSIRSKISQKNKDSFLISNDLQTQINRSLKIARSLS